MTRFLLIRHALTDWVGKSIAGRQEGVPLNSLGVSQAQMLAITLKDIAIAAVYTSPLQRTVETATAIAQQHALIPEISADFIELEYGEWTNCTLDEIKNQPAFKPYNSFRSCVPVPGGEFIQEAQMRMVNGLYKLKQLHPGKTIAVVSHGDPIRAAVAHFAGIHLDLFQRLEISPASISIIDLFDDTARINLLNFTGDINRL